MSRPRTRRLLLAFVVTVVTTATVHSTVTTAEPGGGRPDSRTALALATRPVQPTAPAVAAPDGSEHATGRQWRAVARERMRVLRRPRRATADAIAPAVAQQPVVAAGGIDLAAARKVQPSDAEPAWIAPSSDGSAVCAVRAGAATCPAASLLVVTGLTPAIFGRSGEPYHVWGIAGDDVSSIVLTEADGTRVPVTVTDNYFDVETDDWPRTLTWTGPGGAESFTFPPSAALP